MSRGEYDRAKDVYEKAMARLSLEMGRFSAKDRFELIMEPLPKSLQKPANGKSWLLANTDRWKANELTTRQSRAIAAKVPEFLGEDLWSQAAGWILCPRTSVWCVIRKDHPLAKRAGPFPGICGVVMSRNAGLVTNFWFCNRGVKEGHTVCSTHVGIQKRADAKDAAYRADRAKLEEEVDRASKIEAELREMWDLACEQMDVTRRDGDQLRGRNSRRVEVDSEVLGMFLRRLVETA